MHQKDLMGVIYLIIFVVDLTKCYSCDDPGLPVEDGFYVIENIKTDLNNNEHVYATTPPGFSIRQSTIPNAGLGVFAETSLPKGTRLGPYDGVIYYSGAPPSAYMWEVTYVNSTVKHCVDAFPKAHSSFIRYVNSARTVDEENLFVYQYKYEIYYVTYECIKPGTELLVWYGDNYGKILGLKREPSDYQQRFNENSARFVRTD